MKKCPVCEKTFEDSMRFCQSDGTPLVDDVAEAPIDPYKTIVSPAGVGDPFQPMSAPPVEAPAPEGSGDLLEMPEADPLRTMYVSEEEIRREMADDEPKDAPIFEVPPAEPVPPAPEPPRFDEPSLSPPSFGDMAPPPSPFGSTEPEKIPQPEPGSYSAEPEESPEDATLISPVNPIPSPFSDPAPQQYEPTAPEPETYSPPEPETYAPPIPQSYETPAETYEPPQFKEPEPQINPFDQPFTPAGGSFGQPEQQMEWAPPPAPDASWQNQPVGQNTPFQPPATGGGLNQTLPIVSLVFGIVSICCYISPLTGLVALITGFMGMKNVNNDPANYGGKGLAIAGMITGGVFFLLGVLYWIYIIFIVGLAALGSFGG
jgi:hypothetical protein